MKALGTSTAVPFPPHPGTSPRVPITHLCAQSLSHVQLFVTPWAIACQPLCPWDFPGKNTAVGFHVFLQGIYLTQGSNLCLLHLLIAGRFFTTQPPGKVHRLPKHKTYLFPLQGLNCSNQIKSCEFLVVTPAPAMSFPPIGPLFTLLVLPAPIMHHLINK